jgi:hypothetical protein
LIADSAMIPRGLRVRFPRSVRAIDPDINFWWAKGLRTASRRNWPAIVALLFLPPVLALGLFEASLWRANYGRPMGPVVVTVSKDSQLRTGQRARQFASNQTTKLLPDPVAAPPHMIEMLRQDTEPERSSPHSLGQLAWLLATHPDGHLRNGKEALTYAEEACRQTGRRESNLLDILAAAQAETGQYDDAVRTASEAIDAALISHEMQNVAKIRKHLELYLRHQTVRAN